MLVPPAPHRKFFSHYAKGGNGTLLPTVPPSSPV
jgi:hypothetical protein